WKVYRFGDAKDDDGWTVSDNGKVWRWFNKPREKKQAISNDEIAMKFIDSTSVGGVKTLAFIGRDWFRWDKATEIWSQEHPTTLKPEIYKFAKTLGRTVDKESHLSNILTAVASECRVCVTLRGKQPPYWLTESEEW